MGKKKGASASGAAKVSRDWSASAISNRDINRLRALGFISASEDDIRLPAHELLRSLLFFYGIQLWQLTPNSILHLSIFITVCEAFLGIDPHWGLWRKIFYVKRHNDSNAPPSSVALALVSSAELSAEDLRDEVRRLTCLSMRDNIVLTSARSPYDSDHPPTEDDDEDSDGTEEAPHALEDSDVQEEKATEDDAYIRSRRRKQVHDEFITTAESSPSGGDNDADEAAAPPPVMKSSTSFFAGEDDLDLSDDNDDEVPLAKRAKLFSERAASAKESNPSPAKSTPPSRTVVEKVPVSTVIPPGDVPTSSAGRDHPIYATVDAVVEFAEEFTRLEAENSQLRKTIRSSADQVLEANRLATDAKNENVLLKEEVKKLKQRLKDELDAKHAAAAVIDKKCCRPNLVASDAAEENKKIHEEVEAMTDVGHPNHGLWLHRPKAVVMAKFKYRVGKAHYYFDKFHAHLTMVWNTLFPLDQAPETLSALFTRFKSPERIRQLVRKELLAGAELAFASILACHPSLDLGAVANTERSLGQYYDAARGPAYTVVSRMESCLEKDLKAHWDRGARL
ncbi:hypothetical protein QYE76_019447 [Lolium multiflorum]|uniref:Transposase (putative) gypsy type domain-containing protein n=1 Tax=Lolium multiflorum TaxID=4521 RepID=A0AAD8R4I4_LOLMU|nr:hypothetical protein QYE76_019447 [Lolium multiflorum]